MRIGVDLGGTKIEAIVLESGGAISNSKRIATPQGNYKATVEAVAGLVEELEASLGQTLTVGVGTPGAISLKTGLMKNCNATCLNGQPLQQDLSRRLSREIRIANDADCFALSEASDGAGKEATSVFGVILGTGVGGGICMHGRLVVGVNAIAGEWGHTTLPVAAYQVCSENEPALESGVRRCFCGRFDCVETWLAGPAFERTYFERSGVRASGKEITSLCENGAEDAKIVVSQYCNLLALALSSVINILDPEVIVLGGGMSNIQVLYEMVPEYWPRYVFSDQIDTRISPASFGDSSGVRGAAWLWPDQAA